MIITNIHYYSIIMIMIMIMIFYELYRHHYNSIDGFENDDIIDYAELLSNNIKITLNGIDEKYKSDVLKYIINKFSTLNTVTKNTTTGQKLVYYLNEELLIQTPPNDNNDNIIAVIANEIIDSEHNLIFIIYPSLYMNIK